jgi:alkanesulfonate monooxygenase SsuD/methylene tetrahydromethanopterin reductase-like flavin-dependent oxidoreductase (luciferase family)
MLSAMERATLDRMLACSVVGGPKTVREGLRALATKTGADELIITGQIYDHPARLRSFTLAAEAWRTVVA